MLEAMQAAGVEHRVRTAAQRNYQALIDAELTCVIGGAWERNPKQMAQRNGSRTRVLTPTVGNLELRIPKVPTGSFFPSLLERRRQVDQALFAVFVEADLHGVSTRRVDDLVKALGADTGISRSEVIRICADLDERVGAFRARPWSSSTSRACSSRPPTARPASTPACCPRRIATGVTADGVVNSSVSTSVTPRTGVLDRVPAVAEGPWAGRGPAGQLRGPTPV
jgi:putative transposase